MPLHVLPLLLLALAPPAHARRPDPLAPDPRAVAAHALARRVADDPDRWAAVLVDRLTRDTDDPRVKLRRLHDWIALNVAYDAEGFLAGTPARGDWRDTLRRGSAVCSGYAGLLAELGARAGLRVDVVAGHARGYGFDAAADEDTSVEDHAWNVVHLGDEPVLVDVTWDAGVLDDGRFVRRYTTAWLDPDPALFVHTHLPTEAAWQLLPEPIDAATFEALPPLEPYAGVTLALASPTPRRATVGDAFTVDLRVDPPERADAWLTRDGTTVRGTTWVTPTDGGVRVDVVIPEPGTWVLHLGVRRTDATRSVEVGTLARTATAGTDRRLPVRSAAWRPTYRLIEPLAWDPADPPPVTVRLPGVEEAWLVVGHRWVPMTRDGDVFTVDDTEPWTADALVVVPAEKGERSAVLLLPVGSTGP